MTVIWDISLRDVERNNFPKIAPDFGPYSRRTEGCILIVCALQCNAEYGPKDKQDGGIIFFHVPYINGLSITFTLGANSFAQRRMDDQMLKNRTPLACMAQI
jgi:hypothetical protein